MGGKYDIIQKTMHKPFLVLMSTTPDLMSQHGHSPQRKQDSQYGNKSSGSVWVFFYFFFILSFLFYPPTPRVAVKHATWDVTVIRTCDKTPSDRVWSWWGPTPLTGFPQKLKKIFFHDFYIYNYFLILHDHLPAQFTIMISYCQKCF